MASTNFSYSPTTGTGSQSVSVSANTANATQANRVATLTFTNGEDSASVAIKQKYRPYVGVNGGTTVPQTGGSVYYTVHTEYDVVFRSVPSFVTITANGNTFTEGQRIPAASADSTTFQFAMGENTGETRNYNGMNMAHYIGDDLVTLGAPEIYFSQPGVTPVKNITITPGIISATSGQTSATVTIVATNCTFDRIDGTPSSSGDFSITASTPVNSVITLTFPANTTYSSRSANIAFYLRDTEDNLYASSVYVNQEAAGGISTDVNALTFDYNDDSTVAKTVQVYTSGGWNSSINED